VKDIGTLDMGGNFHGSLLGMILDAGLMVKFVLLILLVLSIISWTIIFIKFRYYRKIRIENEAFDSDYKRSNKLSELLPAAKNIHVRPPLKFSASATRN